MLADRAVLAKSREMIRSAIAFVAGEPVLGIHLMPAGETAVPRDLGDDGRGSNGSAAGVAANQSFLGLWDVELECIDEHKIGSDGKARHRVRNRAAGSLIDIDAIDHEGVRTSDGPSNSAIANPLRQNFAAAGIESLAVVQSANGFCRIENHGCGKDGPEEAPTADFVSARDEAIA